MDIQRTYPDWMFLGENRYRSDLLIWLTGDTLTGLGQQKVWVRYGKCLSFERNPERWIVDTPQMLPGMAACIPEQMPDSPEEWQALRQSLGKHTKIGVFVGFPFGEQSVLDFLSQLEREISRWRPEILPEILILLLNFPRKRGSTDLTTEGDDINQAARQYQKWGYPVSCIHNEAASVILNWYEPMESLWKRKINTELEQVRDELTPDIFNLSWQEFIQEVEDNELGVLGESTMLEICSVKTVERYQHNSLQENYTDALLERMFSGNRFRESLARLYDGIFQGLGLVVWDREKDQALLMEYVKNALRKALDVPVEKKKDWGYLRDHYLELTQTEGSNDRGINVQFEADAKRFCEQDLKELVGVYLEKRCKKIGGSIQ